MEVGLMPIDWVSACTLIHPHLHPLSACWCNVFCYTIPVIKQHPCKSGLLDQRNFLDARRLVSRGPSTPVAGHRPSLCPGLGMFDASRDVRFMV